MEAIEMQQRFFNMLKNVLPEHVSLADELAEKMKLSYDSVYRRIRGEKPLTMAELKMLCQEYTISLDQVLGLQSDTILFKAPGINAPSLSFTDYMKSMLGLVRHFRSLSGIKMRYLCKDMTFFHFYLFPEIAAFKTFFWIKTIQNDPAYSRKRFMPDDPELESIFQIGQQIVKEYNEIPSIELWNAESINSTISQIAFYKDSGMFASKQDLHKVVDSFEACISHLQAQLETGLKCMPGDPDTMLRAPIDFYINEVVLGSNTILIESKGNRESWVTYNVLSYMVTRDERFCEKAFLTFDTLLSRSTLISGTGEKERNKLFNQFRQRIRALRDE